MGYVRACLAYGARGRAAALLWVAFALLMALPAVVPEVDVREWDSPATQLAATEVSSLERSVAEPSSAASERTLAVERSLLAAADGLDAAASDVEASSILARYYAEERALFEAGDLPVPSGSTRDYELLQARLLERRFARLAEFGGAGDARLWWDYACETPACNYLAGAIAFQMPVVSSVLLSLPASPYMLPYSAGSAASLVWCVPMIAIAVRVAGLARRGKLLAQAPGGPAWLAVRRVVASGLLALAFVAMACVPALLAAGVTSGFGSPVYPVTLLHDGVIVETTTGALVAGQLAVLVLTALAVAAIVELATALCNAPAVGALAAAAFCAAPLAPAYTDGTTAFAELAPWLPTTYLNLSRVVGAAPPSGSWLLAGNDIATEIVFKQVYGSTVTFEVTFSGVTLGRAALMLGGTAAAMLVLRTVAGLLARPSLRRRLAPPTSGGA